jgi:hypothetical protein
MQYTARRSIGGRAWMTIRFPEPEMEAAVALWGNTSVGLLLHWWQANKQQSGRGNIGKSALTGFVCLDPMQLTEKQRNASAKLLAQRATTAMLPFNEIALDEARAKLDHEFLGEILGLPDELFGEGGPLDLLRQKLSAEPSIHGGKKGKAA